MKVIHLFGEKSPTTAEPPKPFQGKVYFTCPHCNTSGEMKLHKMIFKSVEFECETCRSPFRITNPAFAKNPKKT